MGTPHVRMLSAALLAAGSTLVAEPARAAKWTEVADAADEIQIGGVVTPNPWSVYVTTGFQTRWRAGRLTREPIEAMPEAGCAATSQRGCLPVNELAWSQFSFVQMLGLEIGLFHDLALTLDLPYTFKEHLDFGYAPGVDGSFSTLAPSDPTKETIIASNFEGYRAGFGGLAMGLRFAPLNDERDSTKSTWLIAVHWKTPWTSPTFRPTRTTSEEKPGSMGDGIHYLRFTMAFSKRMGMFGDLSFNRAPNRGGYVDPYASFAYVLPVPQRDKVVRSLLESVSELSNAASHRGEFAFGVEYIPHENHRHGQKLTIDFRLESAFNSEGRTYSIVADALDRLPYTEQNVEIDGSITITFQISNFVRLHLGFGLGHRTGHFLTFDPEYLNDTDRNGNFVGEVDQVGRRIRSEGELSRRLVGGLELTL